MLPIFPYAASLAAASDKELQAFKKHVKGLDIALHEQIGTLYKSCTHCGSYVCRLLDILVLGSSMGHSHESSKPEFFASRLLYYSTQPALP